jgi:hypothetical protein
MKEKLFVTINSTVIYVIAFLITTIVHELSHAFVGMINDSGSVLHHNFVEHTTIANLNIAQRVSISLSGPVASLLQGLLVGLIYLKVQKQSLFKLFLLWFSVLGFTNFFGYLMTGPFFQAGDIGKVYQLLHTPLYFQIILAVLGMLILSFLAYKLTLPFLQFSYMQKWVDNPKARTKFSFGIVILPWIIGSTIVTILYLPVVAIVSIIYPISSGMIFIFPWQNARRIENIHLSNNTKIGSPSIFLYFSLAVLIIVFKFVLAPGINI